jgi:Flp pilus assembly protein TadB
MAVDADTSAPQEAAGARVIALRADLWRRHTDLRNIDPTDARYPETVTELLDRTAALLAAEAESTSLARSVRRKAALANYGLATALIVASMALVAMLAWLGGGVFRVVEGAVVVSAVLAVMTLQQRRRRHHQPQRRGSNVSAGRQNQCAVGASAGVAAVFKPETGPLAAFGMTRS